MDILPDTILDSIHDSIHKAYMCLKKSQEEAMVQHVDAALSALEDLIQWSYDRYTNIELEDGQEEEKEEEVYRVHPHHIRRANQIAGSFLVRVVAGEMSGGDEERTEKAARLVAHLSGRGAAGPITRTWHIPYLDPNGNRKEYRIKLHEPSYIGNDIGFKTWGAAPLLAKKLIQQRLIPDLQHLSVLELGSGTGLVGLVCDLLGAAQVHLTDYHESVLKNVAINVQLNHSTRATVSKLDFVQVAQGLAPEWEEKQFDVVIASDLLYEMEHAEHLPVAVRKLMKGAFHFMIPLRPTHWNEVAHFEQKMADLGFLCSQTTETEVQEEEGPVRYRYYRFCLPSN